MGAALKGLAYPAQVVPLFLIATFTLLLVIAGHAGLLGIPLALIVISWFFKYAFVLFDGVTLGHPAPPVLSAEMVNPLNEQRPVGQAILVWAYYAITGLFRDLLGDDVVSGLRIAGLFMLPASVATLGVTGSMLQAVNPKTVFGLMYRLGASYLAALICIGGFAALINWIVSHDLGFLVISLPLSLAIAMYGWLALFSVLAMVLYDRRLEIGLETWHSPEQTAAKTQSYVEKDRDRVVDEFYSQWRAGFYANAWTAVQRQIEASKDATEDYGWIYERVARWSDQRMAHKIALELLPRLLEAKRNSEALDVIRERLESDQEFRPKRSSDLVHLAHIARDAGDRPTARTLLMDFEQHYPNDPAQRVVAQLQEQLAR